MTSWNHCGNSGGGNGVSPSIERTPEAQHSSCPSVKVIGLSSSPDHQKHEKSQEWDSHSPVHQCQCLCQSSVQGQGQAAGDSAEDIVVSKGPSKSPPRSTLPLPLESDCSGTPSTTFQTRHLGTSTPSPPPPIPTSNSQPSPPMTTTEDSTNPNHRSAQEVPLRWTNSFSKKIQHFLGTGTSKGGSGSGSGSGTKSKSHSGPVTPQDSPDRNGKGGFSEPVFLVSPRLAGLPPKTDKELQEEARQLAHMRRDWKRTQKRKQEGEERRVLAMQCRFEFLEKARKIWLEVVVPNWAEEHSSLRTRRLWKHGLPELARRAVWPLAVSNELRISPELFSLLRTDPTNIPHRRKSEFSTELSTSRDSRDENDAENTEEMHYEDFTFGLPGEGHTTAIAEGDTSAPVLTITTSTTSSTAVAPKSPPYSPSEDISPDHSNSFPTTGELSSHDWSQVRRGSLGAGTNSPCSPLSGSSVLQAFEVTSSTTTTTTTTTTLPTCSNISPKSASSSSGLFSRPKESLNLCEGTLSDSAAVPFSTSISPAITITTTTTTILTTAIRVSTSPKTELEPNTSEGNSASSSRRDSLSSTPATLIALDLYRTSPRLQFFQEGREHDDLFTVLDTYVRMRPDIGYVQGMSYLAATLLLYLDCYAAFVVLANMIHQYHFRSFFKMEPKPMNMHLITFEKVFTDQLPSLHAYFVHVGMKVHFFCIDWFVTLYSKSLPLDVVVHIWDLFFLNHFTMYRAGVAVLAFFRSRLENATFDEIFEFLTHLPTHWDTIGFIKTLRAVSITDRKIRSLQKEAWKCAPDQFS